MIEWDRYGKVNVTVVTDSVGTVCFDLDDYLCVVLTNQTKESF